MHILGIPCKKIIGVIDIKSRKGGGIMEGLDVALANNGTDGDISTLHNKIERVGVGSFFLDCMRSRLQPLAMKHHLPKQRIFIEVPDQYKPKQDVQ